MKIIDIFREDYLINIFYNKKLDVEKHFFINSPKIIRFQKLDNLI